jgi:hypothetical protein
MPKVYGLIRKENTMSLDKVRRLLDVVVGFGKGGDVAVVTIIRDEELFTEYSNIRQMFDTVASQMRVNKSGQVFQSAKTVLVSGWTSSRHGLDPEYALNAIRVLGWETVLQYEGDTSGIDNALAEKDAAKKAAVITRAQAGKTIPVLSAKGKALVANYELQMAQGAPAADIAASLEATIAELSAVLSKTLILS